jgi:Inner membrane protein YgaP-like, transmembrane domain
MKFESNVGSADRLLRGAAGVVLLVVSALGGMELGWAVVVFAFAALLLGTAVLGFCPGYLALGLHTTGRAQPPKAA